MVSSNLEMAKAALKAANMLANQIQIQQPVSTSTSPQRIQMDGISQMIKAERLKQGMTQKDLGKKAGYSQGTITRSENNLWISLYCMISIFEALGKKIQLINK